MMMMMDLWDGCGKYDYFFTKNFYKYDLMSAEHDQIADLTIRLAPSANIGYQWHEGPVWNFNTELSANFTYEEYDHDGQNEYMSTRTTYHYDRIITSKLKFFNNLEYQPNISDFTKYTINKNINLHTNLTKILFTKFKIE